MTDLVTAMLARKHRLLHERDKLDYQITSLCTAIDALQLPETTPEAGSALQGPAAGEGETPLRLRSRSLQAGSLTGAANPPAAFIDWPAQTVAVTELPIPEKAVVSPDAPPPQPEATVQQVPPAAPIARALPLSPLVIEGLPEPREERGGWATAVRLDILRRLYPKRAITSREIMRELAASPGPRIPDWGAISRFAIDALCLPATNRSHSPATSKGPTPLPISYHDLIARAAEWGITEIHPDDLLAAVNAKAVRIGHKPYALQSRSP